MATPRINPIQASTYVTHRRFRVFQQMVQGRFRALVRKVTGIEDTVEPLVDHVAHTERELQDLDERVTRLERRRPARRLRA